MNLREYRYSSQTRHNYPSGFFRRSIMCRQQKQKLSRLIIPYGQLSRYREKFRQMYNFLTHTTSPLAENILFFRRHRAMYRRTRNGLTHRHCQCTCVGLERIFCNPYFQFRNSYDIRVGFFSFMAFFVIKPPTILVLLDS